MLAKPGLHGGSGCIFSSQLSFSELFEELTKLSEAQRHIFFQEGATFNCKQQVLRHI